MTLRQRITHWLLGNLMYARDIEKLDESEARLVAKIAEAAEATDRLREAMEELRATMAAEGDAK